MKIYRIALKKIMILILTCFLFVLHYKEHCVYAYFSNNSKQIFKENSCLSPVSLFKGRKRRNSIKTKKRRKSFSKSEENLEAFKEQINKVMNSQEKEDYDAEKAVLFKKYLFDEDNIVKYFQKYMYVFIDFLSYKSDLIDSINIKKYAVLFSDIIEETDKYQGLKNICEITRKDNFFRIYFLKTNKGVMFSKQSEQKEDNFFYSGEFSHEKPCSYLNVFFNEKRIKDHNYLDSFLRYTEKNDCFNKNVSQINSMDMKNNFKDFQSYLDKIKDLDEYMVADLDENFELLYFSIDSIWDSFKKDMSGNFSEIIKKMNTEKYKYIYILLIKVLNYRLKKNDIPGLNIKKINNQELGNQEMLLIELHNKSKIFVSNHMIVIGEWEGNKLKEGNIYLLNDGVQTIEFNKNNKDLNNLSNLDKYLENDILKNKIMWDKKNIKKYLNIFYDDSVLEKKDIFQKFLSKFPDEYFFNEFINGKIKDINKQPIIKNIEIDLDWFSFLEKKEIIEKLTSITDRLILKAKDNKLVLLKDKIAPIIENLNTIIERLSLGSESIISIIKELDSIIEKLALISKVNELPSMIKQLSDLGDKDDNLNSINKELNEIKDSYDFDPISNKVNLIVNKLDSICTDIKFDQIIEKLKKNNLESIIEELDSIVHYRSLNAKGFCALNTKEFFSDTNLNANDFSFNVDLIKNQIDLFYEILNVKQDIDRQYVKYKRQKDGVDSIMLDDRVIALIKDKFNNKIDKLFEKNLIVKNILKKIVSFIDSKNYDYIFENLAFTVNKAIFNRNKSGIHVLKEMILDSRNSQNISLSMKEVFINMMLVHPNIVKANGLMFSKERVMLKMERYISLPDRLEEVNSEAKMLKVMHDVSKGLKYLKDEFNLIHCDLKNDNIFYDKETGNYAIGDFEDSKHEGDVIGSSTTFIGYSIKDKEGNITFEQQNALAKAMPSWDIASLGGSMIGVLLNKPDWGIEKGKINGIDYINNFEGVKEFLHEELVASKKISIECFNFLMQMIAPNPDHRPTIDTVLLWSKIQNLMQNKKMKKELIVDVYKEFSSAKYDLIRLEKGKIDSIEKIGQVFNEEFLKDIKSDIELDIELENGKDSDNENIKESFIESKLKAINKAIKDNKINEKDKKEDDKILSNIKDIINIKDEKISIYRKMQAIDNIFQQNKGKEVSEKLKKIINIIELMFFQSKIEYFESQKNKILESNKDSYGIMLLEFKDEFSKKGKETEKNISTYKFRENIIKIEKMIEPDYEARSLVEAFIFFIANEETKKVDIDKLGKNFGIDTSV